MKAQTTLRLAAVALVALGSSLAFVACGGDDNGGNPAPTPQQDSGTSDSTMGMDVQQNGDSHSNTDGPAPPDSSTDGPNPNCQSDATNCNSCATSQQDPLNACSPAVTNCIPFDKTRVPSHPTL